MTEEQIGVLAAFLGGVNQAKNSIKLQVGGMMGAEAKEFFKLRDAFGVGGYATVEEAAASIRAATAEKSAI